MPHPVRTLAFGALALGALASCAADSTGTSTLPPMVPSTTAFATLPPVTTPPTTQPGETTTIPPGAPVEYLVQSGDYLYGIAKNHGVTAEDIVALNGWESIQHELTPGETILVPAPAGGAAATTAPPTVTGSAPAGGTATTTAAPTGGGAASTTVAGQSTTTSVAAVPEGGQEYTVKNNDTVYGIARRFGITPQALVAANGWADVNHNLYPGDTIVVPAPA